YNQSILLNDHSFTLLLSACEEFNSEQFECLIDLISELWKSATNATQDKLVDLLNKIGHTVRNMQHSERILEILWTMAYDENSPCSMIDRLLSCQRDISSGSHYLNRKLKHDYCLKSMDCIKNYNLQWIVPSYRYIMKLVEFDREIIHFLIDKNDLILYLIQTIGRCQHDVWIQTNGNVSSDTLIDKRHTYKECLKIELDLLAYMLKKARMYIVLRRAEELWLTLITNHEACLIDNELGFDWFITSFNEMNRQSRVELYEKHISKLDLSKLTEI
ncbi:unnamed protein product, partial [Didymodactylos carnosus]